jgi:D-alanine-D-alanine ligase-like ATP-grasp enzyme
MPKKKTKKKILKGISDIRRFFYRNEMPIYFISATNFNLLGADEWVKGFKFICYIECFDGLHPNVFSPKEEIPHEEFQSIEDINNYLLEHKEVVEYLKGRGKKGKALFLMFDDKTEKLAKMNGLEVCFPPAKMRTFMDNKVNTNRIAEKAGVPCVPNVLSKVKGYSHLNKVAKKLGNDLVIQTPFGDSGHTTFFIQNQEDFEKYEDEIIAEKEVKVMKRINCRGAAIEACVTGQGTIVAPLMTELVGFKELTPYKGGWCGNEIFAGAFTPAIRKKARRYTRLFGDQLRKEGYKGYFELDFLIEEGTNKIYLGELNPRITGASSITNHAVFALADAPLFIFHLLEWMDQPYELSINAINKRWFKPENIDDWGQLVIKYTDDSIKLITGAPRSGIWVMEEDGKIRFDRMDTHRRAVELKNEAFFLRIARKGDYLYEGADIGILVMRGRLMSNDFKLKSGAKKWISAIKAEFKTKSPAKAQLVESTVAEIGGFKMM